LLINLKIVLKIDVEENQMNISKEGQKVNENKVEYILIQNQFFNQYKQSLKLNIFYYLTKEILHFKTSLIFLV